MVLGRIYKDTHKITIVKFYFLNNIRLLFVHFGTGICKITVSLPP